MAEPVPGGWARAQLRHWPKASKFIEKCQVAVHFWLHSRNGWGILSVSGMGKCMRLPNGEKGHQFESNSIKPKRDTRKRIGRCLQG